jgi:hypothetical protein
MNSSALLESPDRVIAKAWADEDFKVALLANPKEALKSQGIEIPEGVTLNVFENTGHALENSDNVINLVLPQAPDLGLVEEPLDQFEGMDRCGGGCGGRCGGGCGCGGACNCIACVCL